MEFIMPAAMLIISGIIAFLAWKFGVKNQEEKNVNRSKIPASVWDRRAEAAAAAQEFQVPYHLLMGQIWVENRGNMQPRGADGEYGIMQIKPIAWKDLQLQGYESFPGWKENPVQNIRAGAAYLRRWYNVYGSWEEALKAYNQGGEGKERYPDRAQEYYDKVITRAEFFKNA